MHQTPDIRNLYQKKFLQPTTFNQPPPLSQFTRSSSHKFRLFSQRIGTTQSRSAIKCVKIVTNPIRNQSLQLPSTSQNPRKNSKDNQWKMNLNMTQSMHLPEKNNNELIRQLIRVSHQQLGELECSAGGQRKLMSMFQAFFQKRSQTNQKNRQQKKKLNFVPLHPTPDTSKHSYPRPADFRSRQRNKYIQSAGHQKQLTPWIIPDGEMV